MACSTIYCIDIKSGRQQLLLISDHLFGCVCLIMLLTVEQPFARAHQGVLAYTILVIEHVPALRISTALAWAFSQYLTIYRRLNSPYLCSDASIVNITVYKTPALLFERKNPLHVSVPGLNYRTRTRAHVTSLIPPHCTLKPIRCQHSD